MGNVTSYKYAIEHVEQEFLRVKAPTERALQYKDLHKISMPEDMTLNIQHPAVLFTMDGTRDGMYSLDDLVNFVMWCGVNIPVDLQSGEFASHAQARCALHLQDVCAQAGNRVFVDWMLLLLQCSFPIVEVVVNAPRPETNQGEGNKRKDRSSQPQQTGLSAENTDGGPPMKSLSKSLSHSMGESDSDDDTPMLGSTDPTPRPLPKMIEEYYVPGAAALLFKLLNISDSYGVNFLTFVSLLTAGDTVSQLRSSTSQLLPLGTTGTSNITQSLRESLNPTTLDPWAMAESDVLISKAALRCFLESFIEAYWLMLNRLGLNSRTVLTRQSTTSSSPKS